MTAVDSKKCWKSFRHSVVSRPLSSRRLFSGSSMEGSFNLSPRESADAARTLLETAIRSESSSYSSACNTFRVRCTLSSCAGAAFPHGRRVLGLKLDRSSSSLCDHEQVKELRRQPRQIGFSWVHRLRRARQVRQPSFVRLWKRRCLGPTGGLMGDRIKLPPSSVGGRLRLTLMKPNGGRQHETLRVSTGRCVALKSVRAQILLRSASSTYDLLPRPPVPP